jgi:polyphosphate kinase
VSTGNLNESTSKIYGDHCLLTANRKVMADINRIFHFLEKPLVSHMKFLRQCKTLIVCPTGMRRHLIRLIDTEIMNAKKKHPASIILKMNSISDEELITKLYEAARVGVEIKMIVRGIFCMMTESNKFKVRPYAVSIVDQYLEHSRVLIFHNNGKEKVYISSADWMVRNLDHRIEAAFEITNAAIKQELKDYVDIQLKDNVKARILNNNLDNMYVRKKGKTIRSQVEIYNFLHQKILKQIETGSN